jgi:putative YphP/YqiW family bacilliredoxin
MPYNPTLVAPMREEMTRMGAKELTTVPEVDAALGDQKGTMLVFVNSVCGCAAGNARPALKLALAHGVKPRQVVTVFAGRTSRPRRGPGSISRVPAQQSSMALQDGEVVHFVHRHQIGPGAPGHRGRSHSAFDSTSASRYEPRFTRGTMRSIGITVVLDTTSGETYLGRFDSEDERGVHLLDVGRHDAGASSRRTTSAGAPSSGSGWSRSTWSCRGERRPVTRSVSCRCSHPQ